MATALEGPALKHRAAGMLRLARPSVWIRLRLAAAGTSAASPTTLDDIRLTHHCCWWPCSGTPTRRHRDRDITAEARDD